MLKFIASIILILFASQANAKEASVKNCPDFYRFIDFGIVGNDAEIYRGGPVFRAEGFNGQPLLLTQQTQCLTVHEVSKDGHGNPIPVVTSINYNPEKTDIELRELRVAISDDTELAANNNAELHEERLEQGKIRLTRGSSFLCASTNEQQELSCQMVSPYAGNVPLVIYCDTSKCTMPVLVINQKILASASWDFKQTLLNTPELASVKLSNKVQQIHDFLESISSGL